MLIMESKSMVSDKSEQTEDEAKVKASLTTDGKPLKGLLKKSSSSSSSSSSSEGQSVKKEKKRVKFAETTTVVWEDWPEDIIPSIKPPSSDFNLVEIAAQGFMFEPPIEYQDLLPFDPPPDYRDCVQSSFSLFNSIVSCNTDSAISFIDDEDSKNSEKISNELNASASNSQWQEMILNETELLEEDIIDVLKEDEILQAIGSQAADLDNVFHPPSHEDQWNEDDFPVHYHSESSVDPKRGRTGKDVHEDKNSLSSETSSEANSDIASDSSFTSQDTIILTNAIALNKKSQVNDNNDTKSQEKSVINCYPLEYREIDVNLDFEPKLSKPVLEIIHDEEDEMDSTERKESETTNAIKNEAKIKPKLDSNKIESTVTEAQFKRESLPSSPFIKEANNSGQYNVNKTVINAETTSGTVSLRKEENRKSYPQKVSIVERKEIAKSDTAVSVATITENFEKREQQSISTSVELRNNKIRTTSSALPRPKSFPSSSSDNDDLSIINPVKIAKLTNFDMVESLKRLNLSNDNTNLGQFKNKLDLKSLPKKDLIIEYTSEPRGAQQGSKIRASSTGQSNTDAKGTKPVPVTCKPNSTAIHISNETKASHSPSSTSSSSSSSSTSNLTNPNDCYTKSNLAQTCHFTQASLTHLSPAVNQNVTLHSPECIQACSPLISHAYESQSDTLKKQVLHNLNMDQANACIISHQLTPCNCAHPNLSIQRIVTSDSSRTSPTYRYYSVQPQLSNAQSGNKSAQQMTPVFSQIVRFQMPNRQILCIPRFYSTNLRPSLSPNQSVSSSRLQTKTIQMPIEPHSSLPSKNSIHVTSSQPSSNIQSSNEQNSPMLREFSFSNPKDIRRLDGLNPLNHTHLEELAKSGKIPVTLIRSSSPNTTAATTQANEAKDELVQFVEQDIQRIERIKRRYSLSEEDDDPTFGFGRRPSVRGIKPQYSTTNNILKQMQLHMTPCSNRTVIEQGHAASSPTQRVFLSQSQLSNLQTSYQPRHVYLIPHQTDLIYTPRLETNVSMPYQSQIITAEQIAKSKQISEDLKLNLRKDFNATPTKLDKASNSVSLTASKGLLTTAHPNNCFLHYKTISMPNVASIRSSPQILTIIPIKDERGTPEGASSSPSHTSDLPYIKATTQTAPNESKKEISTSNTILNTNNNPDLVKDVTSSSLKGLKGLQSCLIPKENSTNVQTGTAANKEAVIYYSMNV